jgi:hypothetical protein
METITIKTNDYDLDASLSVDDREGQLRYLNLQLAKLSHLLTCDVRDYIATLLYTNDCDLEVTINPVLSFENNNRYTITELI